MRTLGWLARGVTALALALAGHTLVAGAARAEPFGVRLTHWSDPTTTVAVSWNSESTADAELLYGTSPGALDRTLTTTDVVPMATPLGHRFTVRLSGLLPGTTYYYRVGAPGARRPAEGSAPFEFRTLSADRCRALRFIVLGDNRADADGIGPNDLWPPILEEALAHAPDLFLNTGDMVKNGDDPIEWRNFIEASEPGFAYVPSLTTIGNHDEDNVNGDGALYNQLFELPRNSRTDTEDYFGLDVGPVRFVSLNSQFTRPGSTEFTEMLAWADADLDATGLPWRVVFFHKAVYSRGSHSTGEENDGAMNAALVPLFDDHRVDLVFNGHSHDYERFAPSLGVDGTFGGGGRSFPVGNGATVAGMATLPDGETATTYIVTGGAGALTTSILGFDCVDAACTFCTGFNINCPGDVFDTDRDATIVYDGKHNFVVADVEQGWMQLTTYATRAGNPGSAGEVIDAFAMEDATFPSALCGATPPPDAGTPDAGGDPDGPADAGPAVDTGPPTPPPARSRPGTTCACRVGRAPGDRPRHGAILCVIAAAGVVLGRRRNRR